MRASIGKLHPAFVRAAATAATAAPRGSFTATINYNTADIIHLAQSDARAAREAFWRPLNDYRQRMAKLGARHAVEELGMRRDEFAAAIKSETPTARQRRLNSFGEYTKRLALEQDSEAIAAQHARKLSGTAFRQSFEVPVTSARGREGATLQAMGFQLEEHVSKMQDWDDPKEIVRLYHREMEQLLKATTGATHVFCSPHRLRRTQPGGRPMQLKDQKQLATAQPPLHGVHNDFDPSFADELARCLAEHEASSRDAAAAGGGSTAQAISLGLCKQLRAAGVSAAEVRASRVVMINTWRSIGSLPVRRQPLCLVDTRTVAACDVAAIEMPAGIMGVHPLRLTYSLPSEQHAWHWFPEMRPSEVLIFKQFDSADERSCRMLHTAVHHPDTPTDADPRQSCEMRMLCLLPAGDEP